MEKISGVCSYVPSVIQSFYMFHIHYYHSRTLYLGKITHSLPYLCCTVITMPGNELIIFPGIVYYYGNNYIVSVWTDTLLYHFLAGKLPKWLINMAVNKLAPAVSINLCCV